MNATGIPPGGYRWWYFDALSDDGERALTAIFFVGSVFSPSYAARLRRGERAAAQEHVAVNLALYDRGRRAAWVMSEYGNAALSEFSVAGPSIGQSFLEPLGRGGVRVVVREKSAPFFVSLAGAPAGSPVEGSIELEPLAGPVPPQELCDAGGHRHGWEARVPRGRVRARFLRPAFEFDGVGYHDINYGDARLEAAFSRWSWARFHADDRTVVLYRLREKTGRPRSLIFDARDGDPDEARRTREIEPGPEGEPRAIGWGMSLPRWFAVGGLRCEPTRILEAAPFYARYLATVGDGKRTLGYGLGEHLDLDRFAGRWIQFLLRFKTRRITRGTK